jgi:hypothetical protein
MKSFLTLRFLIISLFLGFCFNSFCTDPDNLRTEILRHLRPMKECYKRDIALRGEKPPMKETVIVKFTILTSGKVRNIRFIEVKTADLRECLKRVVTDFSFPPFEGEIVEMTQPINLELR